MKLSDKFLDDIGAVTVQEEQKPTGFDPESADYDMATAESYGLEAKVDPTDGKPHWGSVAEVSTDKYLMLKGRGHETWDLAVEAEEKRGFEVVKEDDGRYYSVRKQDDFLDTIGARPISEEEISEEDSKPRQSIYLSDIDKTVSVPADMSDAEINKYLQDEVYKQPEPEEFSTKNLPEKFDYITQRITAGLGEFIEYNPKNPETKVGEFFQHPVPRVLQNGLNQMNAGIMRIPAYMWNLAQVSGVYGFHLDKMGIKPTPAPDWLLNNDLAVYYEKSAQANNFKAERFGGKDLMGIIKDPKMSMPDKALEASKYIGWSVVENAPNQIALLASAVGGIGTIGLTFAGLLEASQSNAQNQNAGIDIAVGTYNATIKGTLEAVLENVGTMNIFKHAEKAMADSFGKAVTKDIYKNASKEIGIALLGEGWEETLTSFSQDFTDYVTGVNPNALKNIGWRALEAGLIGAVAGMTMTAPSAGISGYSSARAKKNAEVRKSKIGKFIIDKVADAQVKQEKLDYQSASLEILREREEARKGKLDSETKRPYGQTPQNVATEGMNVRDEFKKSKPTVPTSFEDMIGDEPEIMEYLSEYLDPKVVASLSSQERARLAQDAGALIEFAQNPDAQKILEIESRASMVEINRAVEAGETDEGTARLAQYLLDEIDSSFEVNSAIEFSTKVREATTEILKSEGIIPKKDTDYYVAGEAETTRLEQDMMRTAIRLYKHHDADTLVEEWYHRSFDRLTPEEQKKYLDYHLKTGDARSVQEHFAQEGRDFFFSEKLYEGAGFSIEKLFAKAKNALNALIKRISELNTANIPQEIKNLYRDTGSKQRVTPQSKSARQRMYTEMFKALESKNKQTNSNKTRRSTNGDDIFVDNMDSVVPPPPTATGYGIKKLKRWEARAIKYMQDNGVSKKKQKEFIDNIRASLSLQESIVKKADAFDLFPDDMSNTEWDDANTEAKAKALTGAIRKNADELYMYSFDASGNCVKRLLAMANSNEIEKKIGRPLTADETIFLLKTMQKAGFQTPCLYCYVESPRIRMGQYSDNFSRFVTGLKPNQITASIDPKKKSSAKNMEFRKKIMKLGIKYDDIDQRILRDPEYAKEQIDDPNSHYNKFPELYKWLAQKVTGSTRANQPKAYGEYVGQLLNIPKNDVDFLNHNAGFRFFSISDFQIEHMPDLMQAVADGSIVNLKGHNYTKVADFVEIFGNTNLKINMSVFADEVNGMIVENNTEGMAWADAKRLRKKFDGKNSNVGTILVGTSDAIIEWGLKQDWIDFIIPFHDSGILKEVKQKLGWQNYNQYEKKDGKQHIVHIGDVLDFSKGKTDAQIKRAYKKYIKENGIDPKFKKFFNHENYAKLLKDFSRTDTPFNAMQPKFNMKYANKLLDDFINSGGIEYKADKGIIKDVTKAIKGKKKGESLAMQAIEAEMTSRSHQVKAFDTTKPLYHGTTAEFENLDFAKRKKQGSSLFQDYTEAPKSKVIFLAEDRQNAEFFSTWRGEGTPRVIETYIDPDSKIFDYTNSAMPYPSTAEASKIVAETWAELYKINKNIAKQIDEGNLDMQEAMNLPSFRKSLMNAGYDAVRFTEPEGRGTTIGVINKDIIKNNGAKYKLRSRSDIHKRLKKVMPEMEQLPKEYDSVNGRPLAPSFDFNGKKVRLGLVYNQRLKQIGLYYISIEEGAKGEGLGTRIVDNLKKIATDSGSTIQVFPSSNHPFWVKQGFTEGMGFSFDWSPNQTTTSYQIKKSPKDYKTAEEYVKAQENFKLYHGTDVEFDEFDVSKSNFGEAMFFSTSEKFAGSMGKNVSEVFADKDIKLFDGRDVGEIETFVRKNVDKISKELEMNEGEYDYTSANGIIDALRNGDYQTYENSPTIIKEIKRLGYDGTATDGAGERDIIAVYNTGKIKTKAQLTKEWEDAQTSYQIRGIPRNGDPMEQDDPTPYEQPERSTAPIEDDIIDYLEDGEGWSTHYEKIKTDMGFAEEGEKYDKIMLKEEEKKAYDLVDSDPELAMRISYGTADTPNNISTEAVMTVVIKALTASGKIAQAEHLARRLSKIYTEVAQTLNVAKLNVSNSTKLRNEISQARLEEYGNKLGTVKNAKEGAKKKIRQRTKEVTQEVNNRVRGEINKSGDTLQQIDALIEELIC